MALSGFHRPAALGLLAGTLALLAPAAGLAQQGPGAQQGLRPFISPTISTLGVGADVGVRFNEYLGARFGGNYLGFDAEREIDGIDYDADVTLASLGTLLDVYPLRGGFRLSGGVRFNFNQADLTANSDDVFEIGGQVFDADDVGSLNGDVDVNPIAPYLGIGYGGSWLGGALAFAFDLGAMYQGEPDVDLSASGDLANDAAVLAALADEEAAIEDDLEDFAFYPVVSLAISYRF